MVGRALVSFGSAPLRLRGAVPHHKEFPDVSLNVMNKIGNCRSVNVSYGLNSRVLFLFVMTRLLVSERLSPLLRLTALSYRKN